MLRAGVVSDLLSKPVLIGYLTGVAVLMVMSQVEKAVGATLSATFAVDPARVRAVPLGVPPLPAAAPAGASLPIDLPEDCRRYVLAVGTIEPRKNLRTLITAFSHLRERSDLALVLATEV